LLRLPRQPLLQRLQRLLMAFELAKAAPLRCSRCCVPRSRGPFFSAGP